MKQKVAIIGAGISGLTAALKLREIGMQAVVFEKADAVGGRVRTDRHEGFQLDRGFQIFNTAYPTAQRVLDYDALALRPFASGALIRIGGRWHRMDDPLRAPSPGALLSALRAPIGSWLDKLRLALLRRRLLATPIDAIWSRPGGTSTRTLLEERGFSPRIIRRFFQPFYGGVFLEGDLATDARLFDFTFKMFAEGVAALPAKGIQAIPEQLAARLGADALELGQTVRAVDGTTLQFDGRAAQDFDAVVVACEAPAAHALLQTGESPQGNAVTCLYFATDTPPYETPFIALDGDQASTIQTFCVPSLVQPAYAPEGRHLLSVSVLGAHDPAARAADIESEIRRLFPALARVELSFLRGYTIAYALPGAGASAPRLRPGQFLAGDHTRHASLEGAMRAGEDAANAVREFCKSG